MAHQTTGFNPDTFKRLVIGPGAVYLDYNLGSERLLGATRGGNTFEPGVNLRDLEVDGVKGKIRGGRIIDRVEPVLRCNLLEQTRQNLLLAIPGLREGSLVPGDSQGEEWTLNTGSANGGTYKLGDGTHWTDDIAYDATIDVVKHELERVFGIGTVDVTTLNGMPYTIAFELSAKETGLVADFTSLSYPDSEDDAALTQTEEFDAGDAYYPLTLAEIADTDYFTNLALVGRLSGSDTPVVVIIKNVLGGGGYSMALQPAGEVVSELVLEGHFEAPQEGGGSLEFPFEIRWPVEE